MCQTVNTLKQTKKDPRKDDIKPLSYAEAAKHGAPTRTPQASHTAVAWSVMRTFFLRPEDKLMRSKEIPAWVFGARLRQKFGQAPKGGDPPLFRLHQTAKGEW